MYWRNSIGVDADNRIYFIAIEVTCSWQVVWFATVSSIELRIITVTVTVTVVEANELNDELRLFAWL